MQGLGFDLRQARRVIMRSPGSSVLAVITLALGMSATTCIFSVVYSVLLKPLPFGNTAELVQVWETRLQKGWTQASFTEANFWSVREENRSFTDMAAFHPGDANLTGEGEPAHISLGITTPSFFQLLQVRPVQGRVYTDEEVRGGQSGLALVSYRFWKKRFGGRNAVGAKVALDAKPYTIIGVLPAGTPYLDYGDVFVPHMPAAQIDRGSFEWNVVGRLRPGVTTDAAKGDLGRVARSLAERFPVDDGGMGVTIEPSSQWVASTELRRGLWVLMAAVGFLLLIACMNIANLLLARATSRSREIAVRSALGATRSRIVRLLLAESLLLGCIGAAGGLALAYISIAALKSMDPGTIPRIDEIAIDVRVLAFTAMVAIASGALSGLAPAVWAFRENIGGSLRASDRQQTSSRNHGLFRSALVATEVALSLMLLVGAGLLIRSFDRILKVPRGFQTDHRMVFAVSVPNSYSRARFGQFITDFSARLSTMGQVTSAAAVGSRPLVGIDTGMGYGAADKPYVVGSRVPWASWRHITSDYFRTLGIPLLRGRTLAQPDADSKPLRIVISRNIAEQLWPGEDPIGRHMLLWKGQSNLDAEVVGVAADIRTRSLTDELTPVVYLPYYSGGWNPVQFVVYSPAPPEQIAASARALLGTIDPTLPISDFEMLDSVVGQAVAPRRFNAVLLSVFAAIALLLTVAGVFGVLSYMVARRTPEIGVRLALGASRENILGLVVRQGMTPVLLGIAVGLAGALALSRFIATLLFNVTAKDLMTYAAVATTIFVTALAACYVPARRALRVDPMSALRTD